MPHRNVMVGLTRSKVIEPEPMTWNPVLESANLLDQHSIQDPSCVLPGPFKSKLAKPSNAASRCCSLRCKAWHGQQWHIVCQAAPGQWKWRPGGIFQFVQGIVWTRSRQPWCFWWKIKRHQGLQAAVYDWFHVASVPICATAGAFVTDPESCFWRNTFETEVWDTYVERPGHRACQGTMDLIPIHVFFLFDAPGFKRTLHTLAAQDK